MPKKRRNFSAEFKTNVVLELITDSSGLIHLQALLGVPDPAEFCSFPGKFPIADPMDRKFPQVRLFRGGLVILLASEIEGMP